MWLYTVCIQSATQNRHTHSVSLPYQSIHFAFSYSICLYATYYLCFFACLIRTGRPQPRLTWWRENTLLDDSFIAISEKKMKNVLHLEKLERHHLHAQYTCQASNNNVTTPISSAVTLNLNRKYAFSLYMLLLYTVSNAEVLASKTLIYYGIRKDVE